MKSRVVVFECEYDKELIKEKIRESLKYFNLPILEGKKILLKPNLLMAVNPERAITTHPILVEAIVEILMENGVKDIYIGDTPGNTFINYDELYERTGMKEIARRIKVNLVNLYKEGIINIPGNNIVDYYPVSKFIKQVDYIINIPKLKTHSFMLMTCAIKNTFGLIPGMNKSRMHSIAINPRDFAMLLVDLHKKIKPILNIVDAILGMEGEGPSAGIPRKFRKIIIGTDPVAVDVISSLILGYKPEEIYTNIIGKEYGLGENDLRNIEIFGDNKNIYNSDVKKIKNLNTIASRIPGFIGRLGSTLYTKFIKIYPVIIDEKCIKCRICENSCPNKAIFLEGNKIVINYDKCISCFCCHELCPQKAIKLEKSLMARRIFR